MSSLNKDTTEVSLDTLQNFLIFYLTINLHTYECIQVQVSTQNSTQE